MSLSPDLQELAAEWGKNPPEAFQLLGEGLRHASPSSDLESDEETQHHLSAAQLVQGMIEVAVDRCGYLAIPLLNEWGFYSAGDIGELTFFLIQRGVLGKQANDSIQDFYALPDLDELVEAHSQRQIDATIAGLDTL